MVSTNKGKSIPFLTLGKPLKADRNQVEKFFEALFRHADPETYVSLRVFDDTKEASAPVKIESVLKGDEHLIDHACRLIEWAAAEKISHVFSPPVATFGELKSLKGFIQ